MNRSDWLRIEPLRTESGAAAAVTEADRRAAAAFAPRRRQEFLSWRALLYEALGRPAALAYSPVGAPQLPEGEGHIGVSHSRTQVAVRYAAAAPCAVDIESPERNFDRVLPRYLTEREQRLSAAAAWPCIAWCAKETLYKLAGRPADLLHDLELEELLPVTDADRERWRPLVPQGRIAAQCCGRSCTLLYAQAGPDWAVWSE